MMPAGKPWRTGADQATTITSNKPLTFGAVKLEANTPYTINTVPGDKEWQLLFGKLNKPGQWGIPYQPALEIGKEPMAFGKAAKPVEQLTISIDDTAAGANAAHRMGDDQRDRAVQGRLATTVRRQRRHQDDFEL